MKKSLFKISLYSMLVLVTAGSALADQCSWNDRSVAERARAFLAYYPGPVYTMCEPCGENALMAVYYGQDKVDTKDHRAVHFRWQDERNRPSKGAVGWEIVFNEGKGQAVERKVDLAYLFVRSETGFVNVGSLFACTNNSFWNPTNNQNFTGMPDGVSTFIPNETATVGIDVSEAAVAQAQTQK